MFAASTIYPGLMKVFARATKRVWNGGGAALRRVLFVGLLSTVFTGSAAAKDLEILVRYLVPAFLAQNFTALCQANEPGFLSDTQTTAKAIYEFSEHMKMHVTADLITADAQWVVLVAANTALKAARGEVEKFSPDYPSVPAEPLKSWCENKVKSFVVDIVGIHTAEHDDFERIIRKAKE